MELIGKPENRRVQNLLERKINRDLFSFLSINRTFAGGMRESQKRDMILACIALTLLVLCVLSVLK